MLKESSHEVVRLLRLLHGAFAAPGNECGRSGFEAFVPCAACNKPVSFAVFEDCLETGDVARLCGACWAEAKLRV